MGKLKVVMLICDGSSSRIIYHKLKNDCDIVCVIKEDSIPNSILLKNRIKKLRYIKVFGQLTFMVFNKFLKLISKARIEEIKNKHNLDTSSIEHDNIVSVNSINDKKVEDILKEMNPDLVLVNGTRIIKSNILSSLDKPFVNTHVGITPKYRGVHGGYWALANNDKENCGVTVHLVDEGIDTGNILYQAIIETSEEDNFNTYPYLQTAQAIDLLGSVLNDLKNDGLKPKESLTKESALWSHPTIFEYVKNFIKFGVK
mgnify:CR=1 FL=1